MLQLHDELIYEVPQAELKVAAQIVKVNMESAQVLKVKLPVKVKTGSSWATLQDLPL